MPSTLTYPGVYVEEIPSGVRTIAGVSTSNAAFVGFAPKGPVDTAKEITSFADFERIFGGVSHDYPLGYAVRDFYENGGSTAIIVRTYKAPAASETGKIKTGDFELAAASPGTWAKNLRIRADVDAITAQTATDVGVTTKDHLYNLTVVVIDDNKNPVVTERYNLLTSEDTPNRVDRALASSRLVTLVSDVSKIPAAHPAPVLPKTTWEDPASTGVNNSGNLKDSDPFWTSGVGNPATRTGIYALDRVDLFNILCLIPEKRDDDVPVAALPDALSYCVKRRAMLVVDPPVAWKSTDDVKTNLGTLGIAGPAARNAALYFPRIIQADRTRGGMKQNFVPCGMVAGIMARTDTTRGVWKAPAGIDASLLGALGLVVPLNDEENGQLNPLAVNCLRTFPVIGSVVWGSRTMRGANLLADEYKYVPVRRLALFLEESLFRGLQWVVFEPNDEPLWSQIRLNVGAFMNGLFRQGAFQGGSPRDAYFVLCDKTTTTQTDINLGVVNIIVGFAPLKPAEFVVLKIQQIAGQIQT
jgi:phage tail sheath protein FI